MEMKAEHDAFEDVEEGRLGAGVGFKSLLICRDGFDAELFFCAFFLIEEVMKVLLNKTFCFLSGMS